jgi:TfoX/Sxy family transcriptional regulator of competence genes
MKGKKKAKPRKKRFPISVQLVWSNPDLCCPNQNDLQKGERKSRKVTTFLNRSCYQLLLSW